MGGIPQPRRVRALRRGAETAGPAFGDWDRQSSGHEQIFTSRDGHLSKLAKRTAWRTTVPAPDRRKRWRAFGAFEKDAHAVAHFADNLKLESFGMHLNRRTPRVHFRRQKHPGCVRLGGAAAGRSSDPSSAGAHSRYSTEPGRSCTTANENKNAGRAPQLNSLVKLNASVAG